MKNLDPQDVVDICKELGAFNWALKAFGALLESTDLERLFCKNDQAARYRAGLNLIITLFINHQEDKLGALEEMASKSLELSRNNEFKAFELINKDSKELV